MCKILNNFNKIGNIYFYTVPYIVSKQFVKLIFHECLEGNLTKWDKINYQSGRIMLPQNKAPWHIEYFKVKMAGAGSTFHLPFTHDIKKKRFLSKYSEHKIYISSQVYTTVI